MKALSHLRCSLEIDVFDFLNLMQQVSSRSDLKLKRYNLFKLTIQKGSPEQWRDDGRSDATMRNPRLGL